MLRPTLRIRAGDPESRSVPTGSRDGASRVEGAPSLSSPGLRRGGPRGPLVAEAWRDVRRRCLVGYTRVDASFIRLEVDHWDWCRAAVLLEALGGRPLSHSEGAVYRFLTRVARDEALDLVRGRFGWTIASPVDGRP